MDNYHTTVLLNEAVDYLNVSPNTWYIDATLGGAGHTTEILRREGKVLAIDADQDALDYVHKKLKSQNSKVKIDAELRLVRGNFRDIKEIAKQEGIEKVGGVLFDLGVSLHQLKTPSRGFSFQNTGPLDMRMDSDLGVTAKDLVNVLSKKELSDLFTRFGEEPFAWPIAERIVKARAVKPIETTEELSELVTNMYGRRQSTIHPATKVFQALRMAVNDELPVLEQALNSALGLLDNHGRIVVISFHSLEDRIVKQMFNAFEADQKGEVITKKPLEPSENEVLQNPRSRSAKMRVFEKN